MGCERRAVPAQGCIIHQNAFELASWYSVVPLLVLLLWYYGVGLPRGCTLLGCCAGRCGAWFLAVVLTCFWVQFCRQLHLLIVLECDVARSCLWPRESQMAEWPGTNSRVARAVLPVCVFVGSDSRPQACNKAAVFASACPQPVASIDRIPAMLMTARRITFCVYGEVVYRFFSSKKALVSFCLLFTPLFLILKNEMHDAIFVFNQ